jgi:hypothetical protein
MAMEIINSNTMIVFYLTLSQKWKNFKDSPAGMVKIVLRMNATSGGPVPPVLAKKKVRGHVLAPLTFGRRVRY